MKAIDIWKGFCLLFVYGALFEYGVINFLHRVAGDISKAPETTYKQDRRHTILSISETATTLQQHLAQSQMLRMKYLPDKKVRNY